MLKRFLQLLKGSPEPPADFDGSYLDHVLQQIYPRVAQRMADCPAHDPLLVVVAEVLLQTVPHIWEADYKGPLRDAGSPARLPPPPPGKQPTTTPTAELSSTEETAGFHSPADDTSELDIRLAIPAVAEEIASKSGARSIRLDNEDVLHNGRVLLTMLLNNDRLPPGQQLTVSELMLASELWIGFMLHNDSLDAQAQKLLQLIEQKFSDGQFSQARLLLQLFQTDRATLINNDRNLFYEDMILRVGIRRRHTVSNEIKSAIRTRALATTDTLSDENIRNLFDYLKEHLFMEFHLFTRPPEEVEHWRTIARLSTLPQAVPYLLGQLPPRRWRNPDGKTDSRSIAMLVREHIVAPMLREYVIRQMKTTYFILRAVGSTGLENYLDSFFDWSEQLFGVDATGYLSEIYTRTMGQDEMITSIFNDLYDRHYKSTAEQLLTKLDAPRVEKLLAEAIQRIATCDMNEVAPGNYSLGGFVFDALTQMSYPTPDFAFKLHRLT